MALELSMVTVAEVAEPGDGVGGRAKRRPETRSVWLTCFVVQSGLSNQQFAIFVALGEVSKSQHRQVGIASHRAQHAPADTALATLPPSPQLTPTSPFVQCVRGGGGGDDDMDPPAADAINSISTHMAAAAYKDGFSGYARQQSMYEHPLSTSRSFYK